MFQGDGGGGDGGGDNEEPGGGGAGGDGGGADGGGNGDGDNEEPGGGDGGGDGGDGDNEETTTTIAATTTTAAATTTTTQQDGGENAGEDDEEDGCDDGNGDGDDEEATTTTAAATTTTAAATTTSVTTTTTTATTTTGTTTTDTTSTATTTTATTTTETATTNTATTTTTTTSTATSTTTTTTTLEPFRLQTAKAGNGDVRDYTVEDLTPGAQYRFRVVAATKAGSRSSDWASIITTSRTPERLPAPDIEVLSESVIRVTVLPPLEPNGIILSTTLTRTSDDRDDEDVTLKLSLGEYVIDFDDVHAGVEYTFSSTATNIIGSAESGSVVVTTADERAPEGVPTPMLKSKNTSAITIMWDAPAEPHGRITAYRLESDALQEKVNLSISENDKWIYTLNGYHAYQEESLILHACTATACNTSSALHVFTTEAVPEEVSDIELEALANGDIFVSWSAPSKPNGIVSYNVSADGIVVFSGNESSTNATITDVAAYTNYTIGLDVCTSVGCATATAASVQTVQDAPEAPLNPPKLFVRAPNRVEVVWSEPAVPNGVIANYTIMRGDRTLYTGLPDALSYMDKTATPAQNYTYTYIATTPGGSTKSESADAKTPSGAPSRLVKPRCSVLNSTAINIAWSAPRAVPDGVSRSTLNYSAIFYKANSDEEVTKESTGDDTRYTVSGLAPFTKYMFRHEACVESGCAISSETSCVTHEAPPEPVGPPTTKAVDVSTVTVHWEKPAVPNGAMTGYQVWVRPAENDTESRVDPSSNQTGFARVDVTDAKTYVGVHALESPSPYTFFEYVVVCENERGSAFSNVTVGHSGEAAPKGVSNVTFESTTQGGSNASWTTPAAPNGIIVRYTLFWREESADTSKTKSEIVNAPARSLEINGLKPATKYAFKLRAFTRAGATFGPSSRLTTSDAVPDDVATPVVRQAGVKALLVRWTPPDVSNGAITKMEVCTALLPDGDPQCTKATSRSMKVSKLESYKVYAVTVKECTSAGCTTSDPTEQRTVESAPQELDSPYCTAKSSGKVSLSWKEPVKANGVMTKYHVRRRRRYKVGTDEGIPPKATGYEGVSIRSNFTKYRIATIKASAKKEGEENFSYDDEDDFLSPFTTYLYQIFAENAAGATASKFCVVQTLEAAPSGVLQPLVFQRVRNSTTALNVRWFEPEAFNGVPTNFKIEWRQPDEKYSSGKSLGFRFRGAEYDGSKQSYTWMHSGLSPFTEYVYRLTVFNKAFSSRSECSSCIQPPCAFDGCAGGRTCGVAPPTMEAPEVDGVQPLDTSVYDRSLGITWNQVQEDTLQGLALAYRVVTANGNVLYEGPGTGGQGHVINGLKPYILYKVAVQACVYDGCGTQLCSTASPLGEGRTRAAQPSAMSAPSLYPLRSTSIAVQWQPPTFLNGPFEEFQVIRDQTVVYRGSDFYFEDNGVKRKTLYSYVVQIVTAEGEYERTSPAKEVITPSNSPEGVSPPKEAQVAATAVVVTWKPPSKPHGKIIRYGLLVTGVCANKDDKNKPAQPCASNEPIIQDANKREATITGLLPFSEYKIKLQACIEEGCAVSSELVTKTACDSPHEPTGSVDDVASRGVDFGWRVPERFTCGFGSYTFAFQVGLESQDGNVQYLGEFALNKGSVDGSDGSIKRIAGKDRLDGIGLKQVRQNATLTTLKLSQLKPDTNYVLRVAVKNEISFVVGGWSQIRTLEDVPAAVSPPTVLAATPGLFVQWDAPTEMNGKLTEYKLYQSGPVDEGGRGGPAPTSLAVVTNANYVDTSMFIYSLEPFAKYRFKVAACTAAGCTESSVVEARSPASAPATLNAPTVTKHTCTGTTVQWMPPLETGGLEPSYQLYLTKCRDVRADGTKQTRALCVAEEHSEIQLQSSTSLSAYLQNLSSDSHYELRVGASNAVGSVESNTTQFSTEAALRFNPASPLLCNYSAAGAAFQCSWNQTIVPADTVSGYTLSWSNPAGVLKEAAFVGAEVEGTIEGIPDDGSVYRFSIAGTSAGDCGSAASTAGIFVVAEPLPTTTAPQTTTPATSTSTTTEDPAIAAASAQEANATASMQKGLYVLVAALVVVVAALLFYLTHGKRRTDSAPISAEALKPFWMAEEDSLELAPPMTKRWREAAGSYPEFEPFATFDAPPENDGYLFVGASPEDAMQVALRSPVSIGKLRYINTVPESPLTQHSFYKEPTCEKCDMSPCRCPPEEGAVQETAFGLANWGKLRNVVAGTGSAMRSIGGRVGSAPDTMPEGFGFGIVDIPMPEVYRSPPVYLHEPEDEVEEQPDFPQDEYLEAPNYEEVPEDLVWKEHGLFGEYYSPPLFVREADDPDDPDDPESSRSNSDDERKLSSLLLDGTSAEAITANTPIKSSRPGRKSSLVKKEKEDHQGKNDMQFDFSFSAPAAEIGEGDHHF